MTAVIQHDFPSEPFMAFIQDDITRRCLGTVVDAQGWDATRIFNGGIELALETLSDIRTPQLLVIDLSATVDPLDHIAELASVCDAGVRLVCLGTVNDVALYRTLLEMGVEDYLLKPIDPQTLAHALERANEVPEEKPQQEVEAEGEVVSVIGALGGVGTTSVALNLAWQLSDDQHKKVALVDLDLHFGTVALSLDLEPGKGFREALESPSRIDSLFLDRAMVKVNENLSILASETDVGTLCQFDSDALDLLVERLRQKYDVIIIDVPRNLIPVCGDLLARLGKILMVTDLSLAGMRDTLRLSRFAKNHMIDDDIIILANRSGENKERELAPKEFEKGIDGKLGSVIPFDPKSYAKAEMQGCALMKVAKKSKAATAMNGVFTTLVKSDEDEAVKPSLLRRLLGKS